MIDSHPLVSVVLPVFNRKHLIERAITSIKTQSFSDWELLIVDDGSSDGLEDLVIPMVMNSPRIRYLKHANRKLAATRNVGIHAAMGRYISFLDSDDEYRSDHLQLRYEYMTAHPEVDFIHGGVVLIGPEETHFVRDAYDSSKLIHISECCVGATFFGKKKAFMSSGGFKLMPYSAESDFLERISGSFHVVKVDFPTYKYYTGLEDSICTAVKTGGRSNRQIRSDRKDFKGSDES
jgi:glycosyltransferase involved in cell wall biosynthesis